jgi:hypothetical protein
MMPKRMKKVPRIASTYNPKANRCREFRRGEQACILRRFHMQAPRLAKRQRQGVDAADMIDEGSDVVEPKESE